MNSTLFCHVCREQFKDSDLIVPLNINIISPSGQVEIVIFMHYMCGLNHYLDNIPSIKGLIDKDRVAIEAKLMEVMTLISKATVQ